MERELKIVENTQIKGILRPNPAFLILDSGITNY